MSQASPTTPPEKLGHHTHMRAPPHSATSPRDDTSHHQATKRVSPHHTRLHHHTLNWQKGRIIAPTSFDYLQYESDLPRYVHFKYTARFFIRLLNGIFIFDTTAILRATIIRFNTFVAPTILFQRSCATNCFIYVWNG